MRREQTIRNWFGAVRAAADEAAKKLETMPGSVQAVKVSILIRQYLCDRLTQQIADSDGLPGETSEEIQKEIYSELMEDAIAGVRSETENMETAVFLYDCTAGVREVPVFRSMLERALQQNVTDEKVQEMMTSADREMESFADRRKALRTQSESERSENEPPPWLDEFEYIDWVITH